MPCWGSQWPFRLCKCILCCCQTSPGGVKGVREKLDISECCCQQWSLSLRAPLRLIILGIQPPFPLYIPADSSPSSCLPGSVFPPEGKGYSVLLFEVDICIIRLGCVIVSGLPHHRVLQRREGAVQPNNGRLPSSLTLHPGCTCIPPTRPGRRPTLTAAHVWVCSHGVVREARKEGEVSSVQREWEGRGWARYLNTVWIGFKGIKSSGPIGWHPPPEILFHGRLSRESKRLPALIWAIVITDSDSVLDTDKEMCSQ